jgi:UDP-glucose 4-epimerase
MKKVLITGCAGFIGSNLANKLVKCNYKVYGVDDLSKGKKENINKKVNFYKASCYSDFFFRKISKLKFNFIFHFAGQSSGEKSFYNPVDDNERNFVSTLRLLDYAKNTKCDKFIFASSMSVYGDKLKKSAKENDFCVPKSFYGTSKLFAEHYIRLYKKLGLDFVIFRFFNIYGPGQDMTDMKQGMISIYLSQIMKNKKLIVKGSKNRFRDFVFIDDVIELLIKSLNSNKYNNRIINVGTGKKTSILNLINCIKKNLTFPITVKYIKGTPLDQYGVYANNLTIKNIEKNFSFTNLNFGIKKFINHLRLK